jgi:hypothetical protein
MMHLRDDRPFHGRDVRASKDLVYSKEVLRVGE